MLGGGLFRNWSIVLFFFANLLIWKRNKSCWSYFVLSTNFIALSELQILLPACWSSGNTFVSGAGGPRFKSRAGQIKHSVAHRRNDAEVGPPQTRYTLRRNTASIMKDLIFCIISGCRVDLWGRLTLKAPIVPFIPAKRNCKSQGFRFCCCWTFSGFSDAQDILLEILHYSEEKVYSRTARRSLQCYSRVRQQRGYMFVVVQ